MLPYFLRHYSTFASRILIFDEQSTDRTRAILKEYPLTEVRDWEGNVDDKEVEGIDDVLFRHFYDMEYRSRSRGVADWVMCPDVDEFIYHPYILDILQDCLKRGVSVIQCEGYQMISDHFPVNGGQIYDGVRTGIYDAWHNKPIIFSPDIDMSFKLGRHGFNPDDGTKLAVDTHIKLLHYRYLGRDYCLERNMRNIERMSDRNKIHKLGRHNHPESTYYGSLPWFDQVKDYATEVI
jgi:hypothetical protein